MRALKYRTKQYNAFMNSDVHGFGKAQNLLNPNYGTKVLELSTKLQLVYQGTYSRLVRIPTIATKTRVVILKITKCSSDTPVPSEQAELNVHRLLWQIFALSLSIPHILMPYGISFVVSSGYVLQLLEHACWGNGHEFLNRLPLRYIDDYVRLLIFQIAYTLVCIQNVFPKFRHNDLKVDNVFVAPPQPTLKNATYGLSNELTFQPPNLFMALIGDFEFSSIANIVDNPKAMRLALIRPTLNINQHQDLSADLYLCVRTICVLFSYDRLSLDFISELESVWGSRINEPIESSENNYHRAFPYQFVPDALSVLKSSLFNNYRIMLKNSKEPTFKNRVITGPQPMFPQPLYQQRLSVLQDSPVSRQDHFTFVMLFSSIGLECLKFESINLDFSRNVTRFLKTFMVPSFDWLLIYWAGFVSLFPGNKKLNPDQELPDYDDWQQLLHLNAEQHSVQKLYRIQLCWEQFFG